MSDGPGITIVVPLYNKRPFILRCLDSLAVQTRAPDEVIVVDDGSTDGGADLVADYAGLPIRLIRQANAGVSAARNRGVAEARHDWIAFLDADDEYLPGAVAAFHAARAQCPEARVIFGHSRLDGADPQADTSGAIVAVPDYFSYLLAKGAVEVNASVVMVHKAALIAAGLFPPGVSVGEDTDTWMRLGCLFPFARIDAPVAVYHLADGQSRWQDRQGTTPFWHDTYRTWRDTGLIPAGRRRSAARYFEFSRLQMCIFLARSGQQGKALRGVLRDVSWTDAPKAVLAKTILIGLFPAILGRGRAPG